MPAPMRHWPGSTFGSSMRCVVIRTRHTAILSQTLGWIAHYHPDLAVLTHMDQSMDYATLASELPAGVVPGYDGLVIELPTRPA